MYTWTSRPVSDPAVAAFDCSGTLATDGCTSISDDCTSVADVELILWQPQNNIPHYTDAIKYQQKKPMYFWCADTTLPD